MDLRALLSLGAAMIIAKFGGTSVSHPDIISIIQSVLEENAAPTVLVVSAFSQVTNTLERVAEHHYAGRHDEATQLLLSVKRRHIEIAYEWDILDGAANFIDSVFAFGEAALALGAATDPISVLGIGEELSSYFIWQKLCKEGTVLEHRDARHLITASRKSGELVVIQPETEEAIAAQLSQENHTIIGGFICRDEHGRPSTLGRGGSDHSATIVAAALKARRVDIYTDVAGVLTCDPRIVSGTSLVPNLTYKEAAELSYFGAKVLHPLTMNPCVKNSIPIRVAHAARRTETGTTISAADAAACGFKAIALRRGVSIINIYSNRMLGAVGFLRSVFEVFERHNTSIDVVTTSEVSVSVTIDDTRAAEQIVAELQQFGRCKLHSNKAIISAIGEGIRETAGLAAAFFTALKDYNISMISLGASDVNLGVIVEDSDAVAAASELHSALFSREFCHAN